VDLFSVADVGRFFPWTFFPLSTNIAFCVILATMSSDEFYGPALPPGFTKVTSAAEVVPGESRDRKRHLSSSDSSSSSSSSRASDQPDTDRDKLSEKESKSSERLFGPALPEGFTGAGEMPSTESSFIGPVLPPSVTTTTITPVYDNDDEDDDDDDVGPSLALNTESKTESTVQQIESRAKLMKDKLEGKVFLLLLLCIIFYLSILKIACMTNTHFYCPIFFKFYAISALTLLIGYPACTVTLQ